MAEQGRGGLGTRRRVVGVVVLGWAVAACGSTDGGVSGASFAPNDVLVTPDIAAAEPEVKGVPCLSVDECAGAFAEVLACEVVVCSPALGVCVLDLLPNGTPCKDGVVCTGPDFCVEGKCGGGPLDCDDDDPCTVDACNEKQGCLNKPRSGFDCDDGDPCTAGDTCTEGVCAGAEEIDGCCVFDGECDDGDPCTDDACEANACVHGPTFAPCDDGNPCTQKDHCDGGGGCAGETILCEDGDPCTANACDPATGTCTSAPAPDGTACEDGNPCTVSDGCVAGVCQGTESTCQCVTDADCAAFEDDDLCNGTLRCVGLACVVDPLSVVACNPTGDTACVKSQCDPATGQCKPVTSPNGTACDDQNPCTDDDACKNGLCFGASSDCDDGNACTFDACSPTTGCTHVPHTQPCDDGDPCTANDQCGGGVCAGVLLSCDDFDPCTDDACAPGVGCQHAPNAAPCDDGNACTADDACADGACVGGPNACDCTSDADCAALEDGNLCNGTLRCAGGLCVVDTATVVKCNTAGDTACSKAVCLPASGACVPQPAADGAPCSDGSACTSADACLGGACVGKAAACDDANPCTTDTCDPAAGCKHAPSGGVCNDGNPCTGNDTCSGGACNGVPIACDDGNPCTVETCSVAVGGCVATPAPNGVACSDGSACTLGDTCQAGACKGTPATCDDGNPCTADTCAPASGCKHAALANGTPCDDGSACTQGDACVAGACAGDAVDCDDGNPCTLDTCAPATGCGKSAAPAGTPCDDGNPCTVGDACTAGLCAPGADTCECATDADCAAKEDGNLCNGTLRCVAAACVVDPATVVTCPASPDPCKKLTCQAATGACLPSPAPNGTPCSDGDACTTADKCTAGVCGGAPVACDDGNPCTADACKAGACTASAAFDGTPCADDGNACTLDVCQGGTCGHLPVANGTPCDGPGTVCNTSACVAGQCQLTPLPNGTPCPDEGNECTYDQCSAGACQHISNDPAPVSEGQCFPVAQIEADAGLVTGSWDACGTADQFVYSCKGPKCSTTGAIDTWPCADPTFLYDGASTGFEYAYVFVAPADGVCTLLEYGEGTNAPGGGLFPVIDWFILDGSGACQTNACLEYVWENKIGDPTCGGSICSYKSFAVSEGQTFYFVADLFDGVGTHQGYNYPDGWTIEVKCASDQVLLLDEDFSDALCDGCTLETSAPPACVGFGWQPIGGFADLVTGFYLGQLEGNTLLGYDCGATEATAAFPAVDLPSGAASCTLTFDHYAQLDPADDGDCTNDVLEVLVSVDGKPDQLAPGDPCAADTASSNPLGASQAPASEAMTYDLTAFAGSTVQVSLHWKSDAQANAGLGVVVDDVRITCSLP